MVLWHICAPGVAFGLALVCTLWYNTCMKIILPRDVYWLAGLIEGEGSFSLTRGYPRVSVAMTDRDVIVHVCLLLCLPILGPYNQNYPNAKQVYRCQVTGRRAVGIMLTLYQFMSERRQASIRRCIAAWKLQQ